MGCILVVDDDPAICELLEIVLAEEGYDVRCATTLSQALELAQARRPGVILFDMSLFDGDGEHFVARYRQVPQATARLIAISGVANLEDEACRVGAQDSLTKPFEIEDLLPIVARELAEATS